MLDLDGTLIGRDSQVSPRVSSAVGRVSDRIQVSIATGREPSDVVRFARQLKLEGPQISDNGALMLDPRTGATIWSSPLGVSVAAEILGRLDESTANFMATHPGGTVTDPADAVDLELTRISVLDLDEAAADSMVADFARSQVIAAGDSYNDLPLFEAAGLRIAMADAPDELKELVVESTDVVKVYLPYNGFWAVDFTALGVNKATATQELARVSGADRSQVIAAGDSYNDLPLFEAAGLRIAMADAPDELKELADYIAPRVEEDGLAVAIDEFVLPRLPE